MDKQERIDVYNLPGIREVVAQKLRDEKRKEQMPISPGRGKGNLAKATVSRTAAFRGALCDEDWSDIAVTTFNRMMDPLTKNADFVKLAMFLARYNLLSADAQLLIESDSEKMSSKQIDSLKDLLKKDGAIRELPKLG